MNRFVAPLRTLLLLSGRTGGLITKEVAFEYFNWNTNEIRVTDIAGLPPWASPARLIPGRARDLLVANTAGASDAVAIQSRLKSLWVDNGRRGWQDGLDTGFCGSTAFGPRSK